MSPPKINKVKTVWHATCNSLVMTEENERDREQRQLEFDVEWSLTEGLKENQDVYYSDN